MGRLTSEKKHLLLRIERQRIYIGNYLFNKVITDKDIYELTNTSFSNMLDVNQSINTKTKMLKIIYSCPFLLCDQKYISNNIKIILPSFLEYRYNMEIDELENRYKQGCYSKEEYLEEKRKIYFVYYDSSDDGKNIIKKGVCKGIKNNLLVLR